MNRRHERGVMLIASVFLVTVLAGTSAIFLGRSVNEARAVERELDRIRAYAAAEAAFQGALSQIGQNSYTGFINTSNYSVSLAVGGTASSTGTAVLSPETTDYIVIQATGTGQYTTRSLEGRVFLDSNLSKYLVYADTTAFSSGAGAQYGEPLTDPSTGDIVYDATGRARVAEDEYDRASMYFTGDWNISGDDVLLYGNVLVKDDLIVDSGSSADVHGDTYITDAYDTHGLTINDTYDDDNDRHTMTADMTETLNPLDLTFYANHNSIPAFGATSGSRYLQFVVSSDGTHTQVKEYNNRTYTTLLQTYDMPANGGIIYVNGNAYVKGTIKGRISVVSSDDIFIQGNLAYANGLNHANESDAAAYLARDKLFFCANTLEASGIFCAQRTTSADPAFDATYDTNGVSNPGAKVNLVVRGNRIIKGTSNLSYYDTRSYLYDPYLKQFRPPGLPVTSVVSFVREI